jgi:EmrB/QacA subfamily drug resistance transporter
MIDEQTLASTNKTTHRVLTTAALLLGLFLAAMEMTVVSTAMPTAIGDLGGAHLYAWVFAAYTLALTVTVPIFSKLGDLYGRKPIALFGLAFFLAGSAASGQARSMTQLIAFRVIQGLGAGALQPMTLTIVGDLFTLEERARIQGIFGAVWGLAGLIGPMLGGLIVNWLSWRWVFYINIPFGLASAVLLVVAFHERVEKHRGRLDYLGALLLTVAVVLLLSASHSGHALLVYAAAAVVLVLFVFVEKRHPEPLLPVDLFRRRVMAASSAAGALVGAAMFAVVTYIPLHVQAVLGGSPTAAGSAISPMAIGWPLASAVSGRLLPRVGFRPFVRAGLFVSALAATALAVILRPGVNLNAVRVTTAVFGIGMGLANTALLIAVQTAVDWRQRGVATGSTMFFRTIGGTIAVGLLGGVVAAGITTNRTAPEGAVDRLLGPEHGRGLSPTVLHDLGHVLQASLSTVFVLIAALAWCAFALGIFFPRIETRGTAAQVERTLSQRETAPAG